MNKELLAILACPVCKGNLELNVEEENTREIISGCLYCLKCNAHYPVVDAIPNLLPQTGVISRDCRVHRT